MADWDDEILIGEGVVLSSGAAPVTMRMVSGLIDVIIYGGFYIVTSAFMQPILWNFNDAMGGAIAIAWLVTVLMLAPATVEALTRGRSVGRIAMGMRVVRDDGGPVSFRHAFGRAIVGAFETYASFGMGAVTTSMLSARGKRLGDMISGTYAMRTRGLQRALPPITMPYGLQEWAQNADIRRLPDGLALTARMFLGRANTMHVQARARLGGQLTEQFRSYVSPPPPQGTHPETFLTAVLAARREREYAQARRQQQRSAREAQKVRALPYGVEDHDN